MSKVQLDADANVSKQCFSARFQIADPEMTWAWDYKLSQVSHKERRNLQGLHVLLLS